MKLESIIGYYLFSSDLVHIYQLNLPYNIAGVTFLAMGNGAPDVFATMASFGGAGDVLIGIGCLLGASMFINTIAVGSVLITSPCSINPRDFVRDVAFQILGVLSLGLVAALGRVNIFIAVSNSCMSYWLY